MVLVAPIPAYVPTGDEELHSLTTCQWSVMLVAPVELDVLAENEHFDYSQEEAIGGSHATRACNL